MIRNTVIASATALSLAGCASIQVDGGETRYFGDDLAIYAVALAELNNAALAVVEVGNLNADDLVAVRDAANSCTEVLYEVNLTVSEYEAGRLPAAAAIATIVQLTACLPDLWRLTQIDDSPLDGLSDWIEVAARLGSSAWPAMIDLRAEINQAADEGRPLEPAYVQSLVDGVTHRNDAVNDAIESLL